MTTIVFRWEPPVHGPRNLICDVRGGRFHIIKRPSPRKFDLKFNNRYLGTFESQDEAKQSAERMFRAGQI